jgi:alpha-tubulin suppressor-like RCC1 family protein
LIPTLINSNIEILQVSTGEYHTIILSKSGTIYSFGSNQVKYNTKKSMGN